MSTQKFVAHSISRDENNEDSSRSFDEQLNISLADDCEADGDYIPQVALASIPHENQSFQTLDEAKDFYIAYSKEAGFSVRERNDRKNHNQEVIWKMFVCYKEGTKSMRYQEKVKHVVQRTGERERGDVRCKCLAKMTVSWKKDEQLWRVLKFNEKHNHPLTSPSKVHALRVHRDVSPTIRSLAVEFRNANLKTSDLRRVLESDAGGPDKIGCLEKDLYNSASKLQNVVTGHDAETLIGHFETEKTTCESFYFAYETHEAGDTFDRCYWRDAHARNSYGCFPEVVVFDSTFGTNKYGIFFAPLLE
ncbi:Unknown protein [Striga hermonthica]|uniref:FAR1 domain-containing protein n=1 Tax=Striga hermonthica TaxID=68872 RepID=A0A9N7REH2_STRHE|nr:Unknown protein [Striga hermonthica]